MILITGAGGTVSREVATALAGRAPVRLALRDTGLRDAQAPDRVRFDFLDPATFAPALAGVDRVFLLRPPDLARATHDFGPFIAAMRAAAIAQVVFLSVRGAADNPLLPHHRIERLLEKSGLAWTHLRPNDFMQNFATVHRADIRDLGQIWVPAGHGRTSFVDVRDVGEAAARVLTEPGHERRAYTLTGGAAWPSYTAWSSRPSRLATIVGTKAWPATLTAVRPMSRIGSMASSRPAPSRGKPRVDRVKVSITVAPVRPAVAAEPSTDTKTIRP